MNTLKKILLFSFCLLISFTVGCSDDGADSNEISGSDKRVLNAISVLKEHWNKIYEQDDSIEDKYLEIINTKIINIKSDINSEDVHGKDDLFKEIDYMVEFELISNYYDTAPYYFNAGQHNFVIVYKDGTTKVSYSPLNSYRSATFSSDFSPIIESIEDFHDEYDQVLSLVNEG